jgi:hypothetical protein
MTRNVLKVAALTLAGSAALLAPAPSAEAGGYKHHGFKHHGYSYGYYYRPAYVYRAPTCHKYAWVWKHGYKHYICVKYW